MWPFPCVGRNWRALGADMPGVWRGCKMSLPTEVVGHVSLGPESPEGDGLVAIGPHRMTSVLLSTYDWRSCPVDTQDEVISGVNGARVLLRSVVILGGIKAILAGNGDHPGNDSDLGHWEIEDCVILGSGRRCPEVQDGVSLTMRRCWIHDWGRHFDTRAFGAWAHRGGRIIAEDCLFTQSSGLLGLGLRNTVVDLANHIGQAVNDEGLPALLRPRTYLPGICRGLTADTGGFVLATRCYRNRSWIRLENCDPYISRSEAITIVEHIDATLPTHAHERLGMSALELFCSMT